MATEVRRPDAVELLKGVRPAHNGSMTFVGADLRGIDMAGCTLRYVDLTNAKLDEADLSGARISHVNLSGASLRRANLRNAELTHVQAIESDLSGADCAGSVWRQCDLLKAFARFASLSRTRFHACILEEANLSDAELSSGAIIDSSCNNASFVRTNLLDIQTLGSSFRGVDVTEASGFLASREIVVEILQRHVEQGDIEALKLIGAIPMMRHWCYGDWKRYLDTSPELRVYRHQALQIFDRYAKSGASGALEVGLDWRT